MLFHWCTAITFTRGCWELKQLKIKDKLWRTVWSAHTRKHTIWWVKYPHKGPLMRINFLFIVQISPFSNSNSRTVYLADSFFFFCLYLSHSSTRLNHLQNSSFAFHIYVDGVKRICSKTGGHTVGKKDMLSQIRMHPSAENAHECS